MEFRNSCRDIITKLTDGKKVCRAISGGNLFFGHTGFGTVHSYDRVVFYRRGAADGVFASRGGTGAGRIPVRPGMSSDLTAERHTRAEKSVTGLRDDETPRVSCGNPRRKPRRAHACAVHGGRWPFSRSVITTRRLDHPTATWVTSKT